MKTLILTILLIISNILLYAKEIKIEKSINSNSTINLPDSLKKDFNGLLFNGSATLNSKSSYIEIIANLDNNTKVLLFEAYYPLYLPDSIINLSSIEEITQINNSIIDSINVLVSDASIYLKSIKKFKTKVEYFNNGGVQKNKLKKNKIKQLNKHLKQERFLWKAADTPFSKMTFDEKMKYFGSSQIHGFEYYSEGIFSTYVEKNNDKINFKSVSTISYPDSFDWRKVHNAHLSSSPYYDGDPDLNESGNGWMTSVKNQLGSFFYTNGCYLFAPVASLEGMLNLYYNQHLDYDLSEQHILSCDSYADPNNEGGYIDSTLQFIMRNGVLEENCFPWIGYEDPCNSMSKCTTPDHKFTFNNYTSHVVKGYWDDHIVYLCEDSLKKQLIKYGPLSMSTFYSKYDSLGVVMKNPGGHAMCLVGFAQITGEEDIWTRGYPSNSPPNPLIGTTYWIFKNSAGSTSYNNGYVYAIFDYPNIFFGKYYPIFNPSDLIVSSQNTQCLDLDNDGYYNWGIGEKPANCPLCCPDEEDGNDADPTIGPRDDYGNLTTISQPYQYPIVEVSSTEVWSTAIQECGDIIVISNGNLTINNGATISLEGINSFEVQVGGELLLTVQIPVKVCTRTDLNCAASPIQTVQAIFISKSKNVFCCFG